MEDGDSRSEGKSPRRRWDREREEERWEETKGKGMNRSTEQERATGGRVVGWNEMGRGSPA